MPNRRHEWISRLTAIGKEYRAAQFAVDRLVAEARRDPGIVPSTVEIKYVTRSQQFLEETYVIRMYAEFESALRLYWATVRDTNPPMKDLVNGIASRKHITFDITDAVHAAREYRNCLVHEREERVSPIPIGDIDRHLAQFLGRIKGW